MKKIFTFLFFAGLMTGAMAQTGRNGQYRNQAGHDQSSVYNNGREPGYGQPAYGNNNYGQNNGYHSNDQVYQQERGSSYGYGNSQDRNGGYNERSYDRDDRGHDHDRYEGRDRRFERENDYGHYGRERAHVRVSFRFGHWGRF